MIRSRTPRAVALAVFVVATIAYLGWRAYGTLNPDAPIYTWLFLGLEVYAATCAITFYAITAWRDDRVAVPAGPGVTVDVLICTYNEPTALVRQTIRRALAMRYPHRTFVCDDGRREEMRVLAAELGCGYITRADNAGHKAGNLNNALASTSGELVMVLDADHLVRADFLDRLVGYFDDPRVALVQTPQVFYNVDSFQHHFRAEGRRLWHEGAIFHHAMQPGANRWNAAFFVGTGAVLRRTALAAVGNFATGTVTEDAFTSLRLHAAGFRSIYHDEALAYLIAPESLQQYLTQRLRWGQGSMQILRRQNPLTCRGLSLGQRVVYTAALSSFSQALVHLAYYLAPAVFLLGGPAPLRADEPLELLPIVAHIVFDLAFFKLWLGPLARPLVAECFKFLNVWIFLKALRGYFSRPGALAFKVTTKGRDASNASGLLWPQTLLLLVNMTAFGSGVLRISWGTDSLVGVLGLLLATGFAGLFVVIGAMTLLFARERSAATREYTFPDHIPAEVVVEGGVRVPVTVLRVNDGELHAIAPSGAARVDDQVGALLHVDKDESLAIDGRVVEVTELEQGSVVHVEIHDMPARVRDRLFDRFVDHALPGLVNPIVEAWRTGTPLPMRTDALYLPVQTDVL